ncbi:nuclear transport factor 2 family protein [Terrabacter sp. GCM10028922]|uniref:nuclear transport factor 2 family protein n=1 Tax=Terrabacter sp. GCM10028922 TaxID=3273428 RepID=UPI0036D9214A
MDPEAGHGRTECPRTRHVPASTLSYRGGVSLPAGDLVGTYLRALTTADAELVASLFADDGVVHSPLYGPRPAREFYTELFADTSQANLTLKSVMSGEDQAGQTTVSFWFHFDWRLSSGAAAPFDVVDVATLGSDGKIRELHIIYDTVDVRPAFEAEVGHASWRRPRS